MLSPLHCFLRIVGFLLSVHCTVIAVLSPQTAALESLVNLLAFVQYGPRLFHVVGFQ